MNNNTMTSTTPISCAIAMCDLAEETSKETDRSRRLLPCCSQRDDHKMHEGCIRKLCAAAGTPLACPLCRDNMLETLRQLLTFRNDIDYNAIQELQPVLAAYQNSRDMVLGDGDDETQSEPEPDIGETQLPSNIVDNEDSNSTDSDWLPDRTFAVLPH